MKISEQSKELVNQMCAMTRCILDELEKATLAEVISGGKDSNDTEIDLLRKVVFEDLMCEVHKSVHLAHSITTDSDEKILNALKENGTSANEIIVGVLLKMTKEVMDN